MSSPVHFYNNPRTTGVIASVSLVEKLMDLGISGLKDSSSNMAQFGEIANMTWKKKMKIQGNQVQHDLTELSEVILVTEFGCSRFII